MQFEEILAEREGALHAVDALQFGCQRPGTAS